MESCDDRLVASSLTSRYSEWIVEALDELPDCFLLTDPALAGHPIVFASRAFLALSGYSSCDVLGRNARLFQGPATDRRAVLAIREAVRAERPLQTPLLNYYRDGSPHWILFHMRPVFAASDGRLLHFLAVQVPILPRQERAGRVAPSACRNEVARVDEGFACSCAHKSFVEMGDRGRFCFLLEFIGTGLEAEEPPVAGEKEKERASNAANSIMAVLNRYSKLTGMVVCGERCGLGSIPALCSSLNLSLGRIKQSFVLTDPHLPNMPIVYASDSFLDLTGYSRHEVLGRNCSFLNGPSTNVEIIEEINDCIRAQQSCTVRLLNYRKDRSSFCNRLHISPVRNATGKIAFNVWVQMDEGTEKDCKGLSPEIWQLGAVGAVKVAVRGLSASTGSSTSPPR